MCLHKKQERTNNLLSFPARFTAKKLHLALFNFVKKYVTLQQNLKTIQQKWHQLNIKLSEISQAENWLTVQGTHPEHRRRFQNPLVYNILWYHRNIMKLDLQTKTINKIKIAHKPKPLSECPL